MNDEPFLICHVVRGEPAFDIAIKQDCAICLGDGVKTVDDEDGFCDECDGEGYWWIVATSGHRARPFWHTALAWAVGGTNTMDFLSQAPPGWPDHYPLNKSPKEPGLLDRILGSLRPKAEPIKRRV